MGASQWSDLPKELVSLIAKHLSTRIDVLRFRAVCRSWRSFIPPFRRSPSLPFILPFPISSKDSVHSRRRGYFVLDESTIYRLDPLSHNSNSHSWLLRIKEPRFGQTSLQHPFSKHSIRQVPDRFPKVLNLLEFRASEICTVYGVSYVGIFDPKVISFTEPMALTVGKVALSSKPVSLDDDFAVLAIYNGGDLCSIVLGDEKWIVYEGDENSVYQDIVNFKAKFYAVDEIGRVLVIDELSLELIEVLDPPSAEIIGEMRLVKSFGDLFLIYRDLDSYSGSLRRDDNLDPDIPRVTRVMVAKFKFFKLNEEVPVWEEVHGLNDRALFMGEDNSFSVSTLDFKGCRANCLYFADECANLYDKIEDDGVRGELGDPVIGLFNLEDGIGGPLALYPENSTIFWPPPAWLRPDPSSSGC